MGIIKRDLKKFEDYDYYDLSEINCIKYRNQIQEVVNEKYNPTEVNVGNMEKHQCLRFPEKKQLAEEYKELLLLQEKE